jgi:hypothetical protein
MLKEMKNKLYIEDYSFSHAPSSSWYNQPNDFEWCRSIGDDVKEIVITNLFSVSKYPKKKVYGWLIEPPEFTPSSYNFAKENYGKFEKIFTYDKELLNISEKFELLPIGGCWIEEKDRYIHEKNKLVCTITSNKKTLSGHRYRHEILNSTQKVDLYGSGFISIDKKIDVLKDYMFCVVVENQKMDFLFTEKIIDCFVTGTIPIYWGCPSIGNFFNLDGILVFNTTNEFLTIIENLSFELYQNKIKAVKENFELCKNYLVSDNHVYNKIKNIK